MGATATADRPKAKGTLTDKQEQFCLEYLIDFNATQAAIRAGYSPNGANIAGPRLLSNVIIQAKLAELKAEKRERTKKTADEIRERLENIAFTDLTDLVSFNESGATFIKSSDEIDPKHAAAIESIGFKEDNTGVSFKIKKINPLQALIKLGQEEGIFKDKVEHSGSVAHTVNVISYKDAETD